MEIITIERVNEMERNQGGPSPATLFGCLLGLFGNRIDNAVGLCADDHNRHDGKARESVKEQMCILAAKALLKEQDCGFGFAVGLRPRVRGIRKCNLLAPPQLILARRYPPPQKQRKR